MLLFDYICTLLHFGHPIPKFIDRKFSAADMLPYTSLVEPPSTRYDRNSKISHREKAYIELRKDRCFIPNVSNSYILFQHHIHPALKKAHPILSTDQDRLTAVTSLLWHNMAADAKQLYERARASQVAERKALWNATPGAFATLAGKAKRDMVETQTLSEEPKRPTNKTARRERTTSKQSRTSRELLMLGPASGRGHKLVCAIISSSETFVHPS